MTRPLPDVTDPEFAPFWEGAACGELRLVFCSQCQASRWPPRAICARCHSFAFEWRQVAARGNLYTWTVVEHQTTPGIQAPYAVGLVEIAGHPGVRLLGQVTRDAARPLEIGMPLAARFEHVAEGVTLVNWTPEDPQTVDRKS